VARGEQRGPGGQTKAERRQARAVRQERGEHKRPAQDGSAAASPSPDGLDKRLERIERALSEQTQRSRRALAELAKAQERAQAASGASARALRRAPDGPAAASLARPLALRRENVLPVDQPLALICQAPRSGGTLLGRLFDGHPRCHAHPHELHIGARRPHTWPDLRLDEAPEAWWAKLEEDRLGQMFEKGKRRIPLKAQERVEESFYPFLLPPAFQRSIFLDEVERRSPIESERAILDAYMTSLFNGWLDNQNLQGTEKRWVAAFSPRRAWGDGLDKLFEVYPDGRLISILRDPESWFSSAQGRDPEADPEALLEQWNRSAGEMTAAKERYPDLTIVIRFDDLVRDTPGTMGVLAKFLEIDYDPVLATPTFNGYPVGANSSYEVHTTGVLTDPVERYKDILDDSQRKRIVGATKKAHDRALKLAERPGAKRSRSSTRRTPAKKAPAKGTKAPKPATARKKPASTNR
jgi:sulfotransferase family protein